MAKNSPSGHHHISSQLRHISTIGKKSLSSDMSSTCSHNMVNFGLLSAENLSLVWGIPANFNGFRVLAALLHDIQQWASAKICGVEQRAPPVFGRATITLGIGPHSSITLRYNCSNHRRYCLHMCLTALVANDNGFTFVIQPEVCFNIADIVIQAQVYSVYSLLLDLLRTMQAYF